MAKIHIDKKIFILPILGFGLIYATAKSLDQSANNTSLKKIKDSNPNFKIVDRIEAIIYHPEGTKIITTSDLKPGLDGTPRTLEQVVFENLMLFDAQQMKLTVTDNEVDKYIAQLQAQNNLTSDDIKELFKQSGYTFEEGYEQLRKQFIIDRLTSYRIKDKVLIDDAQIQEYYTKNPEYSQASYEISQAMVPIGSGIKAMRKLAIQQAIDSGEIASLVSWSDPIELKDSDIAPEKSFIKNLDQGEIVLFGETDEGFIIVRMLSKKPSEILPLEQEQSNIRRKLLNMKFEEALKSYKEKLLKSTRVKYN